MPQEPSTKFLVDESAEFRIVKFLREGGFDTKAVAETSPSISDDQVLQTAYRQKRTLVTNDTDFGKLVFKEEKLSHGVILIRMPFATTEEKIARIDKFLKMKPVNLDGLFTVVTQKRIRPRPLPQTRRSMLKIKQ